MRLPGFLRTTTFRLAVSFAAVFGLSVLLLFAFIYWETAVYETARIDRFLGDDAAVIARQPEPAVRRAVAQRSLGDLHRITYAALFDADGKPLLGNVTAVPAGLPLDGRVHALDRVPLAPTAPAAAAARLVGRRLANGEVLLVGRNVDALHTLSDIVFSALELGVVPALLLSIAAGAFVSWRAQQRVKSVHQAAERILYGDLRERLPVRGTDDDFDRLARSVNLMLDEIGRLLTNLRRAGNDIAHDLRQPLARLRERLARAKEGPADTGALRAAVDQAVTELDRNLASVTTLMRIAEIEAGRRGGGAERFDLAALAEEVGQIYQPVAEDAELGFAVFATPGLIVSGDRGLLLEAIATLVQNAIKFTPPGGRVRLEAMAVADGSAVRVADTGPGIPPPLREKVFERFFRADPAAHPESSGLGLSLVAAIAKSHGYRVTIENAGENAGEDAAEAAAPGAVFTLWCRPEPGLAPPPRPA